MLYCTRCVMDSNDDPGLYLDPLGVCQYCLNSEVMARRLPSSTLESERRLQTWAGKIKAAGRGQDYDCILGISGGTDSAYVLHLARQLGLRPLVVHFDNGWNTKKAVRNIKNLLERSKFDLFTYVVDWPEFQDIQRSILKASLIWVELVTDHAFFALIYQVARRHRIKYSLIGTNLATEAFCPEHWGWNNGDLRNLKAIHSKFGTLPMRTLPTLNIWKRLLFERIGLGFRSVSLLDCLDYNQEMVLKTLANEYDFEYCGGKHFECMFTKFFHSYILPVKWGIDTRKIHYSSLIQSGQLTREAALEKLALPQYDPEELRIEKPYVLKKLGFSEAEFHCLMTAPKRCHSEFASDTWAYDLIGKIKLRLLGPG
jgi:N-acetyl sugar amidotransferase